jgi:hypothetical protein
MGNGSYKGGVGEVRVHHGRSWIGWQGQAGVFIVGQTFVQIQQSLHSQNSGHHWNRALE